LRSYNTTAAGGRSEFRDVDRDLSGADTDGETIDEATTELIRKVTRDESTDERATRHAK
jgi:hypothetical protein